MKSSGTADMTKEARSSNKMDSSEHRSSDSSESSISFQIDEPTLEEQKSECRDNVHGIIPRKPDMLKDQSLVLESINEFSEVSASEFEPSMYKGKSAHEDNSL